MIIWIASYPKSGNTWVRSFISSLLYSNDETNDWKKILHKKITDEISSKFEPEMKELGYL